MKRMFSNGRFANVTATLALVLAMGGTSYAAYTLPHNSVGSWQIKYHGVKNSDIGGNAVTSSKVLDGSLEPADFDQSNLPVGPAGPAGEAVAHATLDQFGAVALSSNKNVVQSNVAKMGSGTYCFTGLTASGTPIDPTTAMVTVHSNNATNALSDHIAAVAVGYNLAGCAPAPGVRQTRVEITKISGVPALDDYGFSIWFEK